MSTHFYARATASSTHRTNFQSPRVEDAHTANPSASRISLNQVKRNDIERHSRLAQKILTPKPQLPEAPAIHRPCGLTALPTELQSQIYEYSFPKPAISIARWYSGLGYAYNHLIWPALLHVSRAVREQAAFAFYSRIRFIIKINKLSFSVIYDWLERIPRNHQRHLSRNQNLRIIMDINSTALWSGHSEQRLTDQVLWGFCRRFGCIYDISNRADRMVFPHFSRLAEWWLFCSDSDWIDIYWEYGTNSYNMFSCIKESELIWKFLKDCLSAPSRPCVQRHWTRTKEKKKMKKEALEILTQYNHIFMCIEDNKAQQGEPLKDEHQRWEERMQATKGCVESW